MQTHHHTTTAALLLVLLAAALCAFIPSVAAEDGEETSAWSAYLDPVADVWATRMGYSLRGREQLRVQDFDQDEDEDSSSTLHLKRNQENGGGSCNVNATNVCNGKGNCTADVCVCQKGWTGPTCHHERKEVRKPPKIQFLILL
jgi:hypothetical protein